MQCSAAQTRARSAASHAERWSATKTTARADLHSIVGTTAAMLSGAGGGLLCIGALDHVALSANEMAAAHAFANGAREQPAFVHRTFANVCIGCHDSRLSVLYAVSLDVVLVFANGGKERRQTVVTDRHVCKQEAPTNRARLQTCDLTFANT